MSTVATLPRCPVCGFEVQGELPKSADDGRLYCARSTCSIELAAGDPGEVRIRTFRLANHYSLFVLPFAFADQDRFDAFRRLKGSPRWKGRTFLLANPDDVDRTEYFLPYVRRFLFPSLFPPPTPAGINPAARPARPDQEQVPTCQHFDFDLSQLGKQAPGGLPLTLKCHDSRKRMSFSYPLILDQVQLIVFSYRVGFLVLRVRNAGDSPSYFDQMNTAAYLRTIAPLYRGFDMPELDSGGVRFKMTQLLPYLLAEFAGGGGVPPSPAVLPAPAPLPVKPIYDDRMMIYTFSCLDKESCLADEQQCKRLLHRGAVVNFEDEPEAPMRGESMEAEGPDWLRLRWQGFSKDGGSLVVFNTDRYHERFLGVYHGTYYFDIFLLASLQRVTLLTLFERLSDIQGLTTASWQGRKHLRRVRLDLLLFKNQCWFSQITNRERGLELWRHWQKTFENRRLLREVNEQAEELDNYLQARTRERVDWLVRLGGFLATVIPAIFGLDALLGIKEGWFQTLKWTLLIAIVAGTGLFAWLFLFRKREEF